MKSEKICDLNKCTGCYACYNICPVNAIKFDEDKLGNVYPNIDMEKCIGCNMCRNICPSLSDKKVYNSSLKCYAAFSKSKEVNYNSSSGGIAYELGKYVISRKGVYYGVSSYCPNSEIIFERISNIEDLKRTQGSKYVHAHIKDTYKKIKEDLDIDLEVLFIATPCQISGLKAFLKREYKNLYTVDIICHGVPSQKLLKEEIQKEFNYISFRKGKKFNLVAKNANQIVYNKNKYCSKYYYLFLKGDIYRESCYNCKYATHERVGDITIGDFWGLENKKKESKLGTSVVLINSQKGFEFISRLDNIEIYDEDIEKAYKNNPQLNHPTKKNDKVNKFISNYSKNSNFKKSVVKMYNVSDWKRIIVGNIKECIKKILRKDI